MRRLAQCLLFLALASALCPAAEESLDSLKAHIEHAPAQDRPELCIRVAQEQLRNADKLYNDGHVDEARSAVADIVTYSEKAREAAIQTKKHLKNIEIDARKMSARLRDIKRTLAFEDQPPLEEAIRHLEDIRTALLKEMFANKKDKP